MNKELMNVYKNVPSNTKTGSYTQSNFKQALVYKSLLCCHLEQNVITIKQVTTLMIDLYDYKFFEDRTDM